MPEVAVKTRDDVAIAAIQDILKQEDYNPKFLQDLIKACQTANQTLPSPEAIIINGKPYPVRTIREHLAKFVYMLPPEKRPAFDDDSLYDDSFLNRLSGVIDEVSGFTPTPPPANIPQDLKNLVAEFDKAQQAAVSAQAKSQGWSPEKFREQIALQDKITIQMHQVRQATLAQLGLVIDNSQYLENLAASLGHKPEAVKRLAKIRLNEIVNQAITAQTYRQAMSISKNPSQLAALFTKNLRDNLKDDLVGMAVATNKKDAKPAIQKIEKTVASETETAKPAIEAAAKNLEEHPAARKAAQKDAVAAVKQVDPQQKLKPAKAARLAVALARHPDNPDRQERIIRSALGATSAQAKIIRGQLAPQINQLAKSSVKPNYLAMADPDSIFNDISLHPNRFPRPLVDAVRSGRINDPGKLADAIIISRNLNIPLEAVVLSQWGIDAQKLAGRWRSPKFLGFIPMGHGLDPKDATIAKLSDLAAAQKQLAGSLKQPPPLLPDQAAARFLKTSSAASRSVKFGEFLDKINPFLLPSALSYNFPPLSALGNASAGFSAKWRVDLGPLDGAINFLNSLGDTARSLPDFATRPFRAVGSAISNTIINPVKTWANTQIKDGLAKAGAWLAKKGLTKAAKDIGVGLVGKGTAALLAQGVPVAGQIFAAALIGGDILKFLWDHKDKVGMFLGGMFLWGQMMLGNLINLISSLGTLGLTTGIGALLGTIFIPIPFVGTAIGAAAGFSLGLAINAAGGLGAALSGLGTALGSAAAGLSSFIGALTAPSLVAGLGSTIATAGLLGVGAAWAIQTFFIQPNINSALFVAPDYGSFPPGGIQPPFAPGCPQGWPVTTGGLIYQIGQGIFSSVSHRQRMAIDIFLPGARKPGPQNTIVSTHDGLIIGAGEDPWQGLYVDILGDCGGIKFISRYVHMDSLNVVYQSYVYTPDLNYPGLQRIAAGATLGVMGDTGNAAGPHLHYEFRAVPTNYWEAISNISNSPFQMQPPFVPKPIPSNCTRFDQCNVTIP